MSRLSVPSLESASGATAEIYAHIKKAIGNVPNTFAAIGAHGPAALKAVLAADAVLASGTLTKRDQETIMLIISGVAGCDYCVAAHSLLGKLAGLKPDELKKIRDGKPTGDAKRDALVRFVRTLAETSGTVSDDDFTAIKAAGYTDAQLVDISSCLRNERLYQRLQPHQRHRDRIPRCRVKRLHRSKGLIEEYNNEQTHRYQHHTETVCRRPAQVRPAHGGS
jgi:uncharacterized peroxidase-related enzyme